MWSAIVMMIMMMAIGSAPLIFWSLSLIYLLILTYSNISPISISLLSPLKNLCLCAPFKQIFLKDLLSLYSICHNAIFTKISKTLYIFRFFFFFWPLIPKPCLWPWVVSWVPKFDCQTSQRYPTITLTSDVLINWLWKKKRFVAFAVFFSVNTFLVVSLNLPS